MPPPQEGQHFIERVLDVPSWELVGRLLVDIINPACGSEDANGWRRAAPSSASAAHGDDSSGPSTPSPPSLSSTLPLLSTPVRITLRRRNETAEDLVDLAFEAVSGGASSGGKSAAEGGGEITPVDAPAIDPQKLAEQQRQQQLRRQKRRPSVERAMDWYSDGSSSDSGDDDEEDNKKGGKRGGGGGRGGRKSGMRGGERRTSARRQKQDEIREADVAAARENNMKVCSGYTI